MLNSVAWFLLKIGIYGEDNRRPHYSKKHASLACHLNTVGEDLSRKQKQKKRAGGGDRMRGCRMRLASNATSKKRTLLIKLVANDSHIRL